MSDPSPSPGGPQAEDVRPNENRSNNTRGSRNIHCHNQNWCHRGNCSTYEGKQTKIKDHVYDVGAARGGNDLFDKTTWEIMEFVSRTMKGGGEFLTAMDPDALGFQLLTDPLFPDDDADELELEHWKLQIHHIDERRAVQEEVTRQVFAIIKGQCSPTVVDRIEASHDWNTILQQHDMIALLNLI